MLTEWAETDRRVFPCRKTSDPFRVLVAEVLLQRSRGSTVAGVYEDLFGRWTDAPALSRARAPSIVSVIRPLGLVGRAERLKAMATEVVRLGGVPDSMEGLLALPGVGRYAASATIAVAFGKRVPVVDGVTARVYRRYFGSEGNLPASTDSELWDLVDRVTPHTHVREWNWAVLDLAAAICLPKKPRCEGCPLRSGCAFAGSA